jgi:mannosyltransferase OCH1-like enzyme
MNHTTDYFPTTFAVAMRLTSNFQKSVRNTNKIRMHAPDIFDQFTQDWQKYYRDTPRIPKIIHHIWIGSPLPEKYKKLRQSWKNKHPDWVHMLWDEQSLLALDLENRTSFLCAQNYGEKSDIARYELLYIFGGLYVDTDYECLKQFDILHHTCDFFAGTFSAGCRVNNALIGSIPKHPIIRTCIDYIKTDEHSPRIYDRSEIIRRTGPKMFTDMVLRAFPASHTVDILFPIAYLAPWPDHPRPDNPYDWVQKESFAIHLWNRSWIK